MQDAAFKMLFRHPLTVEMLVRKHAPDHFSRIDFSTLRQLGTEQVGEALVRRYPDMLWTARTHGGAGQVVILLEFQGRPDRLMALRMAIYQLLTVQEVIRRARPSVRTDSIEVLSFVIHHGRRPWGKAPSLRQLFGRLVPGFFRMIEPDGDAGAAHATGDLVGIILALERNRSVDGTVAMVQALARVAEETDSAYNRFIAACVREMLVSRGWITREQLKEAGTMTQVSTAYQRSLEDYGQRWFRQGRDMGVRQGREEGVRRERHAQRALLCRRARQRFGAEVAEDLAALLRDGADFGRIFEAMDAVVSSATGDELLERVRRMPKG